jgi:hypothetical protein
MTGGIMDLATVPMMYNSPWGENIRMPDEKELPMGAKSIDEFSIGGVIYVVLSKLAEQTGYDREYLRRLAKSGKIDAIQVDNSWIINPEDLARYQHGRANRQPHVG